MSDILDRGALIGGSLGLLGGALFGAVYGGPVGLITAGGTFACAGLVAGSFLAMPFAAILGE